MESIANSVIVIDKKDILEAVARIFAGQPKPVDLVTLRGLTVIVEGMLDGPLPTIKAGKPNDYGELPGGLCCQRATGRHCYEHDPANAGTAEVRNG